jgi:hypothetical protein
MLNSKLTYCTYNISSPLCSTIHSYAMTAHFFLWRKIYAYNSKPHLLYLQPYGPGLNVIPPSHCWGGGGGVTLKLIYALNFLGVGLIASLWRFDNLGCDGLGVALTERHRWRQIIFLLCVPGIDIMREAIVTIFCPPLCLYMIGYTVPLSISYICYFFYILVCL